MRGLIKSLIRMTYPMGVPFVLNRGELPFILNKRGLLGEGVEVGIKHGQFSEYLLQHWKGRRLYSVDAWRAFPSDEYQDVANVSQADHDRFYANTCLRLAGFGARSHIVRALSSEAAGRFPDGQLDFVYLDARHDYAGVVEDLAVWFPKVHRGGMLAGHDYLNGSRDGTDFGVKRAVDEFARSRGYKVRASWREAVYKSWFIFL